MVVITEAGRDSGTILFDLTWGTAAFAVAFLDHLGIVAGLVPGRSAAGSTRSTR